MWQLMNDRNEIRHSYEEDRLVPCCTAASVAAKVSQDDLNHADDVVKATRPPQLRLCTVNDVRRIARGYDSDVRLSGWHNRRYR